MAGQNPQAVANLLRNIYESEQYQTNAPAPFQRQGFAITNWLGLTGPNSAPRQLMSMFDPRTRVGLLNLASLFVPGGGKFDASAHMGELGMPGQFEAYSLGKSAVGGQRSFDIAPHDYLESVRQGHAQHAHDLLFGGTVHARGALPKRPAFNEPPADTAGAIANKLGISRERVQAQMRASEKANKLEAQRRVIAKRLYNHGIQQRPSEYSQELINERVRQTMGHDRGPSRTHLETLRTIAHASQKQAALERLYSRMAFNHRN